MRKRVGTRIVRRDEHGASAVEYAIMVALIAAVIVLVVVVVGLQVRGSFCHVSGEYDRGGITASATTPSDCT